MPVAKRDGCTVLPGQMAVVWSEVVKETLAVNLRRIRTERGLSVQTLARKAGVARATIIALEAGTANPTLETLMSIAESLGVQSTVLLANQSPQLHLVRAHENNTFSEDFGVVRILDQMTNIAGLGILDGRFFADKEFPRGPRGDQPDTYAFIFVVSGRLLAGPATAPVELATADYIRFRLDQPYVLRALDSEARILSGVCSTHPTGLEFMIPHKRRLR